MLVEDVADRGERTVGDLGELPQRPADGVPLHDEGLQSSLQLETEHGAGAGGAGELGSGRSGGLGGYGTGPVCRWAAAS